MKLIILISICLISQAQETESNEVLFSLSTDNLFAATLQFGQNSQELTVLFDTSEDFSWI